MTATTRPPTARWHALLQPRWLVWHAFVVLATAGMLVLGDWQLRRAQAGNQLSWAYTFEWPIFAAFTLYFWVKSLRDELRPDATVAAGHSVPPRPDAVSPDAGWLDNGLDAAADVAARPAGNSARPTPADGEAYVAWLKAEVQHRGGRWQRWLR